MNIKKDSDGIEPVYCTLIKDVYHENHKKRKRTKTETDQGIQPVINRFEETDFLVLPKPFF